MKLQFQHTITELRNFGMASVTQMMIIEVDYNPREDSFDLLKVDLFENGSFIAEISKLLHKAEGNPLNAMVEAIDWKDICEYSTVEKEEPFDLRLEHHLQEISSDDLLEQFAKITRDHLKINYGMDI